MKKRICTYLLLGFGAAFSVTGHTQTKPIKKNVSHKNISATTHHSTPTKSVNKNNPTTAVAAKPGNKKTHGPSKTTNTPVATAKLAAQRKPVAASKSVENPTIVSAKLKNDKQSIGPSTWNPKYHSIVSIRRKHSIISSQSGESAWKPSNYKQPQTITPSDLNMDTAESNQIIVADNAKPFHPIILNHPQTSKINTAHVSIETSLFLDGLEVGLSKELILQLTDIFAWDIDFANNLRPGDQFTIVYAKKIVDGKESDSDEIIAAEFINQGSTYAAVRYTNENGITNYYTPDGQSMQRAFLSTPVDFIRISSPFDMHRQHPILNRIRAHKGIDYAARTGTPVKTTGDGIITFSGRKGAYGQVVIIQHNDRYETLYAHMSAFKKGLQVGNRVKQGDVIGYVGQTGLATGPHLHYEFHVDGIYRDPESVKIPHSMPISNALLDDFNAQTQPFFVQLNQAKAQSLLAKTHSTIAPPAFLQPSHFD